MNALIAEDTVLLPVPLRLVNDVAVYLKSLNEGSAEVTPVSAAEGVDVVTVPGQGEWSQRDIQSLAESLSYQGVIALFDHCASNPDTWVVKSVVEKAQGITPIQLRNELGALSKLTRKQFGKPRWPVRWRKEQGKYSYRMDEQIARWWTEAHAKEATS